MPEKKKKILVHCCTNWNTSNFGDVLFAEMIVRYLLDAGFEAALYDPSPFVCDYLYKERGLERYAFGMRAADACLYFAGGYFGEHKKDKLARRLIHFKRFMPFGIKAGLLRKKISVIGVGAGEHLWLPSRLTVKSVCKRSFVVTVRDAESAAYLRSIGVKREIAVCSDIAQTIDPADYCREKPAFLREGKEYYFLHTDNRADLARLYAEGLKEHFAAHGNAVAVVGNDYKMNIDRAYAEAKEILGEDRVIRCDYVYPDGLCAVLSACKTVLTYKLHVGIIASALGASVLSFWQHEKIPRYYAQIGQPGRCIALAGARPEEVAAQVARYAGEPVVLPAEVMASAKRNWEELDRYLQTV